VTRNTIYLIRKPIMVYLTLIIKSAYIRFSSFHFSVKFHVLVSIPLQQALYHQPTCLLEAQLKYGPSLSWFSVRNHLIVSKYIDRVEFIHAYAINRPYILEAPERVRQKESERDVLFTISFNKHSSLSAVRLLS